jgi:hypothetical protein
MGYRRRAALPTVILLALAGCAPEPVPPPPPAGRATDVVHVGVPTVATAVLAIDDPAALAVATSRALFATAPAVVLAAPADVATAAGTAQRLGIPLLVTPADAAPAAAPGPATAGSPTLVPPAPASAGAAGAVADPAGIRGELTRLGARATLTIGDAAARWATSSGAPGPATDPATLPASTAPPARPDVLVLTADAGAQAAAVATARASGARVEALAGGDPRTAPGAAASLRPFPAHVLGLGTAFGTPERLAGRLAVAATGVELPGGGQVLFPGRRMTALYGHPGSPALGVLGEQDLAASVARAEALAGQYRPLVSEPVVPAFEIIATVADAKAGADGDYSAESAPATLLPWVDAAAAAGIYVVLDLQPGRADFLSQAQLYADLLRRPNVGLALDPEWRLGPTQVHRVQIGTVGIAEVNRVVTWLADLTRDAKLPQKLLMLHQFQLGMISGRDRLDTSRDELAMVIHSDGFGTPDEKMATWTALHGAAPAVRWGWKNFYDEDRPTFTPAQTVPIGPTPPVFVSYQ